MTAPGAPETERSNPRTADLDLLTAEELVSRVFAEDEAVTAACRAAAFDVGRLVNAGHDALAAGGRVVYVGAGTSGRLALLDAVELAPTFSLEDGRFVVLLAGGRDAVFRAREGAEDSDEDGMRAVAGADVGPLDLVVGITASGRTPFTLGALRAARRRGARTALILCAHVAGDAPAEIVVRLDTGPEALAGSTRMKAGSATKMVLNAFSLGVMTRLGKVHGNRMVDVRPTCRKLVERARTLVVEIAGVDAETAARLLDAADGSAKVAIVMALKACDAATARAQLAATGGVLRHALEAR